MVIAAVTDKAVPCVAAAEADRVTGCTAEVVAAAGAVAAHPGAETETEIGSTEADEVSTREGERTGV